MGLFSFLGGIAKGFGRAVGTGVEWLGEVTGIQGIKNFGQGLKDLCADEISTENTFRKSSANINTTQRISDILTEFTAQNLKEAESIEEQCIKIVENYYDSEVGKEQEKLCLEPAVILESIQMVEALL